MGVYLESYESGYVYADAEFGRIWFLPLKLCYTFFSICFLNLYDSFKYLSDFHAHPAKKEYRMCERKNFCKCQLNFTALHCIFKHNLPKGCEIFSNLSEAIIIFLFLFF